MVGSVNDPDVAEALEELMRAMTLVRRLKDETSSIKTNLDAIEDTLEDLPDLGGLIRKLTVLYRDLRDLEQKVLEIELTSEAARRESTGH